MSAPHGADAVLDQGRIIHHVRGPGWATGGSTAEWRPFCQCCDVLGVDSTDHTGLGGAGLPLLYEAASAGSVRHRLHRGGNRLLAPARWVTTQSFRRTAKPTTG